MFNTILVHPLFNLLTLIYATVPGHDFGVAVIILTILMRLAIWPLLAKQLHSQKAMQELAPEVAKVRAKAKGDKQKESAMLMELYKEKEINPIASLVPLLIQLPLFLALFWVLKDIIKPGEIAKLAYPFVRSLDLTKAIISGHTIFKPTLFGWINLTKPNWILALTAAGAQYYQTKQLTPKQPGADAQAKAMSSMTSIFPVITGVIALTLPSALALYWTVASLVAILQQHLLLRQDVEELEEKAA